MSKRRKVTNLLDNWVLKTKCRSSELTPPSNPEPNQLPKQIQQSLVVPVECEIGPEIYQEPHSCAGDIVINTQVLGEGEESADNDKDNSTPCNLINSIPKMTSLAPGAAAEGYPLEACHYRKVPLQTNNSRSWNFSNRWYELYPWMHYDLTLKKILSLPCVTAKLKGLFPNQVKLEEAFTTHGFNNWNNGNASLRKHEESVHHREAISKLVSAEGCLIDKQLSAVGIRKQEEARIALRAIFTSMIFLAKQGLAIRGSENETGNFIALLNLRSIDIVELKSWLRTPKSWTSGTIQNEILQTVAHCLLRRILGEIRAAEYFSIIVDETSDCSVKEQVSISVRIAKDNLDVEEFFLGHYETASTTGEDLTALVLDSLKRFALPLEYLRGQCYDGAANMAGQFRGVQARILEVQEKAIFVHCFNHSLNLALQDTITKNQFFRNLLSNVHEIGTIMKGSPKRNAEFEKLLGKSNSIKPRPLCPSRWTVRVRAIDGILSGYDTVLEFFENLSGSDDKVATKAAGIYSQLEKGEFYMGLIMAKKLFSLGESLAKVLQAPAATISGAIEAATFTIKRLLALKSEETFEEMWVDFGVKLNEYSLHEPQAPRIRNRPKRFDKVDDSPSFDSAKSWLQHAFFQAIDFMCEEIGRRFDQSGLSMYDKMESALLKCASGRSDDLTTVCDFYGWDSEKLLSEVSVLRNVHNTAWTTTSEIVHIYKGLKQEVKILFPTLQNYLKHLLVVPCSSAGAERSFSWLRRIKSYLRSTMGQARLNHCCLINCYGDDIVDQLDLAEMMLEFVRVSNREATFGKI